MPHWIALLPGSSPSESEAMPSSSAKMKDAMSMPLASLSACHLSWWSLQFTPRVALLEDAVVLEVQASKRLFGGTRALLTRIVQEAAAMHGLRGWAHADTARAAVALARAPHPVSGDPSERLNALPLEVLPGVAEHAATLARLGCRTLADVRALPRGGLSRRFGAGLLQTLDQAYGLVPQPFEWVVLPPVFDARLELPGRVESAPAMLFAATRLLQQLCAWLAGRQAGASAFTLRWRHDWHSQGTASAGEWTVRLASPSRDPQRLSRLLAEHLQRIQLDAPVGEIGLHVDQIDTLPLRSHQLFQEHREDQLSARPDALLTAAAQRAQRDALLALLDKLSVRLGGERVLQAKVQADHRYECMQAWQPAVHARQLTAPSPPVEEQDSGSAMAHAPQPGWILPQPMRLPLGEETKGLREYPVHLGPLKLLAGPHRVEAGWWDGRTGHARVTRDYYLASSPQAGLLWVFKMQPRSPDDTRSPWFLHGFFA